jgi:hypothetical protein
VADVESWAKSWLGRRVRYRVPEDRRVDSVMRGMVVAAESYWSLGKIEPTLRLEVRWIGSDGRPDATPDRLCPDEVEVCETPE